MSQCKALRVVSLVMTMWDIDVLQKENECLEASYNFFKKNKSNIKDCVDNCDGLYTEHVESNEKVNGLLKYYKDEYYKLIQQFEREFEGNPFFGTEADKENILFDESRDDDNIDYTGHSMFSDLADSCNLRIALCVRIGDKIPLLVEEQRKLRRIWGRLNYISDLMAEKYSATFSIFSSYVLAAQQPEQELMAMMFLSVFEDRFPDIFSNFNEEKCFRYRARANFGRFISELCRRNSYRFSDQCCIALEDFPTLIEAGIIGLNQDPNCPIQRDSPEFLFEVNAVQYHYHSLFSFKESL